MYAIGVILYRMVVGHVPYKGSTSKALLKAFKKKLKMPRSLPQSLQNLLHRLMDKNPETRMTLDEARVHP